MGVNFNELEKKAQENKYLVTEEAKIGLAWKGEKDGTFALVGTASKEIFALDKAGNSATPSIIRDAQVVCAVLEGVRRGTETEEAFKHLEELHPEALETLERLGKTVDSLRDPVLIALGWEKEKDQQDSQVSIPSTPSLAEQAQPNLPKDFPLSDNEFIKLQKDGLDWNSTTKDYNLPHMLDALRWSERDKLSTHHEGSIALETCCILQGVAAREDGEKIMGDLKSDHPKAFDRLQDISQRDDLVRDQLNAAKTEQNTGQIRAAAEISREQEKQSQSFTMTL